MDDEHRKKKIEAGKCILAQFKKKRNKSPKFPVNSRQCATYQVTESSGKQIVSDINSSAHYDTCDSQSSLCTDSTTTLSEGQDSSSSLGSLVREMMNLNIDESSESLSGSDSTGTLLSSSGDSTTEKSLVTSYDVVQVKDLQSLSNLEGDTDNRPDEEKVFESIPTEEKEKDVLVEEILVSEESHNIPCAPVEKSVSDVSSEMISFSAVTDDDPEFLNAGDTELNSFFYCHQMEIEKLKEALQKRDSTINQLSSQLELNMNVNSNGNSQIEKLKEEVNLLKLQMKEATELLEKQKQRNLEYENCACQTENVEFKMYDTGIHAGVSSLLQSGNLDEISLLGLLPKEHSTDSETLLQVVQKLKEFLLCHFSHKHIKELVTLLKNESNIKVPEKTDVISAKPDVHECDKIDSATILKKITSLNTVAKFIESLVSISASNANDIFCDFSPSKFQSFFLRRLNSMETGDVLPDMSESESVVSDINYAEVETPCSKPVIESTFSLEKLRRKNISEEFSLVTDFLQEEMVTICSFLQTTSPGSHGDGLESQEQVGNKEDACGTVETSVESDHQQILLHKSKLEIRLKNLKSLDKELQEFQQLPHQVSIDSDTLTMSEDNLMLEELPHLSCISLLSLTDSEYKADNITTDSETNFSRKVSLDMSRSTQDRDFCIRCEKSIDLLKEKYENDIINLKEQLENSFNSQKIELQESINNLESQIMQLKTDKECLTTELSKQIEYISETATKSEEYYNELMELKNIQKKVLLEKIELERKLKESEEKLAISNLKISETLDEKLKLKDEKAEIEIALQNQIADLIQEHEQELDAIRHDNAEKFNLEKKHLEINYKNSLQVLMKQHEEELDAIKGQIRKEFEEREQKLLNEHSKTINMIEAAHCDESAVYQKRIEKLLEEKCELLTKTTQEYETILKKNHRVLVILCKQLLAKINAEKEKIANESLKLGCDLDASFSAFEQLNTNLENGLVKFLNQNYFMNTFSEEFSPDDTEYLPINMNYPIGDDDVPPLIKMEEFVNKDQKFQAKENENYNHEFNAGPCLVASASSLDSDDINMINTEINKFHESYQKDVAFYKEKHALLESEIETLTKQNQELEDQKKNLEVCLNEKDKELIAKESLLSAMDAAAIKGGSQLSATDIRSWQV